MCIHNVKERDSYHFLHTYTEGLAVPIIEVEEVAVVLPLVRLQIRDDLPHVFTHIGALGDVCVSWVSVVPVSLEHQCA